MADAVNAVSPIRVFNSLQARKLAAEQGDRFATMALPMKANLPERFLGMRQNPASGFDKLSDWWHGKSLEGKMVNGKFKQRELPRQMMQRNMLYRRAAASIAGAAVVAPVVMGHDNFMSRLGGSAATTVATTAAAAGVAEWGARSGHPLLGGIGATAIMGYSVFNAFRRGDNVGPY